MAQVLEQAKSYDFKCQRCGECCKRYYIVSTPEEIAEQAKLREMGMQEFLDAHCQLFLQLFSHWQDAQKITVHKNFLPKKIMLALEKQLGALPDYFIALPMVCFRREESAGADGRGKEVVACRKAAGACTFYTQDGNGLGGCAIYGARPLECRLFPFISMNKNANFQKLYPFCHGLKKKQEGKSFANLSAVHFNQTSDYFGLIAKEGFSAVWGKWPGKGILLYKDKPLGEITEQEFFQAIAPYK